MHHYLTQLIDDIRKASWNVKSPHELWLNSEADPNNELELEDISFAEQFLYGEKKPISEITGVEWEQLPAPEILEKEQQALLAGELEKLLVVFNFILDFPDTFPANLRYPFIRNLWTESHVPLSFGENHIEFCDYNEEDCPFPGYCLTCKDVEAQMKFDEQKGNLTEDYNFKIDELLPSSSELERWMHDQSRFSDDQAEADRKSEQKPNQYEASFDSGLLNHNGNLISLQSIPVPGLCIICEQYEKEYWDENPYCQMKRFNQRGNPDFNCEAFRNR